MTLVTPKRFTFSEYHRLIELGFLTEDDRVELIRGELIQMAAKGTLHSVCNTKLFRELDRLVGEKAVVRGQEPIILPADSEPEPDIAIARMPREILAIASSRLRCGMSWWHSLVSRFIPSARASIP